MVRSRRCLLSFVSCMETVAAVGLEAVSKDALRTRFIENSCKVLKVSEHSKPLVGLSFWTFPFVLVACR